MIEIKQTGSPIRRHHRQRAILIGLGLNRIGRVALVPDTPETRGMIAKVKHLIQVTLRVTFDSNAYRQAVDPSRSRRDASPAELRKINAALKDGRIRGYLSETLATLEGVQKAQRGAYFARVKPTIRSVAEELPDGLIKLGITIQADDSLHPALHTIVARWIAAATLLGLRFLYAPRIGAPRPSELLSDANFAIEATDEVRRRRQERFLRGLAGHRRSRRRDRPDQGDR